MRPLAILLLTLAACGGPAFSTGSAPIFDSPAPSASTDPPPATTAAVDPPPPDAGGPSGHHIVIDPLPDAGSDDAPTTGYMGNPNPILPGSEAGEPADAGVAAKEAAACTRLPSDCTNEGSATWCSGGLAWHCPGGDIEAPLCTPASSTGDFCCPIDLVCQ